MYQLNDADGRGIRVQQKCVRTSATVERLDSTSGTRALRQSRLDTSVNDARI